MIKKSEGRLPKYFFQEMCSSRGKETIHKVSAAFIVKNCHPRTSLRLQLRGAIYPPDSFVLMLSYCVNLKAIRYESMSLNRIVADKSHRVIVA